MEKNGPLVKKIRMKCGNGLGPTRSSTLHIQVVLPMRVAPCFKQYW